jgi:hypothetical protein
MLPFYAILRAVPDKFGGVVAMFGAIGVLFVLPWLDTSKVRSMRYRPTMKVFFLVFVAGRPDPGLVRRSTAGRPGHRELQDLRPDRRRPEQLSVADPPC